MLRIFFENIWPLSVEVIYIISSSSWDTSTLSRTVVPIVKFEKKKPGFVIQIALKWNINVDLLAANKKLNLAIKFHHVVLSMSSLVVLDAMFQLLMQFLKFFFKLKNYCKIFKWLIGDTGQMNNSRQMYWKDNGKCCVKCFRFCWSVWRNSRFSSSLNCWFYLWVNLKMQCSSPESIPEG